MAEHGEVSNVAAQAGISTAKTLRKHAAFTSKTPASLLGREPELRFFDRRTPAAQSERFPMNQTKNEENRSDS